MSTMDILNQMRVENNKPYQSFDNSSWLYLKNHLNDIRSLCKRQSNWSEAFIQRTTTQHQLNKEHRLGVHLNLLEISDIDLSWRFVLKKGKFKKYH